MSHQKLLVLPSNLLFIVYFNLYNLLVLLLWYVLVKKTSVPFQPFRKKVMLHFTLLFSLFSPIQSWILPPGSFLSEFATSHDRASITVYLPTSEFSTKSIRNNQKYVTSILEFATNQSKAEERGSLFQNLRIPHESDIFLFKISN